MYVSSFTFIAVFSQLILAVLREIVNLLKIHIIVCLKLWQSTLPLHSQLTLCNGEIVIFAVLYLQPLNHPYGVVEYKLNSFCTLIIEQCRKAIQRGDLAKTESEGCRQWQLLVLPHSTRQKCSGSQNENSVCGGQSVKNLHKSLPSCYLYNCTGPGRIWSQTYNGCIRTNIWGKHSFLQ